MRVTASHFGHMVHGVLPYISYKRTKGETIGLKRLERSFQRYIERFAVKIPVPLRYELPEDIKDRLREYWWYVIQLIRECDDFEVEPHIGERQPDLVLYHQGRIYVVEIKTTHPFVPPNPEQVRKAREQIIDCGKIIAAKHDWLVPVYGYKLTFNSDLTYNDEPIWTLMYEFVP